MSAKRWLPLLALLGLTSAGIMGWAASRKAPHARFVTATVERGRISARVAATGTLSALVTVQVGSQISGRIQALGADFNTKVKKGQVLARIDPQILQAALAQARASLRAAEGQLAKAQASEQSAWRREGRSRMLAEGRLIADADLEQAEADAAMTKAETAAAAGNVEQARASVRQAEVNLSFATIASPVDGTVISRNVDVGQTVAASLQAPTLFTIAGDLTKMQVDTSVAEADVGKLRPGMAATFSVDAYPSQVFRGTVREVRNAPQAVQGVVTYDAVVDVENGDWKLKPGMTAHADFVHAEHDDVLTVPNAALRYRPAAEARKHPQGTRRRRASPTEGAPGAEEGRALWLVQNGVPAKVTVTTGITDGLSTEVLGDAIQVGDRVIVEAEPGDAPESTEQGSALPRLF